MSAADMRWNPRRRHVTAVVYAPREKKPKSEWSKLEVSKLVVGALTPILIAGFGTFFTIRGQQEEAARRAEDQLRVRKADAQPLIEKQQSNVIAINSALEEAERAVVKAPADRDKALAALDAKLKTLQESNSLMDSKLHYLVNDPGVAADMAGSNLQYDIDISTARECIENNGIAGKTQCSVRKYTAKFWRCNIAMTYALDMFERLPVKMDGLDTKDCHISSMVVSQDPEGLKKAQDMAKALGDFLTEYNAKAASAAGSAASH